MCYVVALVTTLTLIQKSAANVFADAAFKLIKNALYVCLFVCIHASCNSCNIKNIHILQTTLQLPLSPIKHINVQQKFEIKK